MIYVAGYGRSGSTTLDIALSAHPRIEGFGELASLHQMLADGTLADDRFWAGFPADHPRPAAEAARIVARAERAASSSELWPRSGLRRAYLDIQRVALAELAARSGAEIVLDSSKSSRTSAWRLPLLSHISPQIHCLILVRDLQGVVRSVRRGRGDTEERQRLPTTRAVVGWTLSNLTAVATALTTCGRSRVRLVRYERFAAEPESTLDGIIDWIGLDRSPAIADGVANGFTPSRQIDGNRVRNQAVVRIDPEVGQVAPLRGPSGWLVRRWGHLFDHLVLGRVPPLELGTTSEPAVA